MGAFALMQERRKHLLKKPKASYDDLLQDLTIRPAKKAGSF